MKAATRFMLASKLRFGMKLFSRTALHFATVILRSNVHKGGWERSLNRHQVVRIEPDIEAFKAAALRCPLPSAVELIGEKWAFLILRGALNGLEHFEQFQAALGIARNILSNRLAKLVNGGILERKSDPVDRRKVVYSLSPKGEALLPVVLALRQWGEDWGHGCQEIFLADKRDGQPVKRICVEAHDGRELKLGDMMWVDRASGATVLRGELD
jgi:DNA-binding HxlR family transcriptional regulator